MEDSLLSLTPHRIVAALDKHIVGQDDAKKIVAIALRNRARRRSLDEAMQEEVSPKNILMIGPTGVGKTEIARRLAKLTSAPFVKVEATKYTEVGYVGRDVESMVRDLVETSIKIVREEYVENIKDEAEKKVRTKLVRLIDQNLRARASEPGGGRRIIAGSGENAAEATVTIGEAKTYSLEEIARKYERGEFDDEEVEIEVHVGSGLDNAIGMIGVDEQAFAGMRDMMEKMMPEQKKRSKMSVAEAKKALIDQEIDELLDMDRVVREAVERAEQTGIIFIDELDKVCGRPGAGSGPDVSRMGVQRDILPIVEGCTISTKHGLIRTDHILFIAAGAFHQSKPSDLIPELQGRFPLRVELHSLTAKDFKRILLEPEPSLLDQYKALLAVDGVLLEFSDDAVEELAGSAARINEQTEDIGARRLHTILERTLQDVSFDAPEAVRGEVLVDAEYVKGKLLNLVEDQDLSRFIL